MIVNKWSLNATRFFEIAQEYVQNRNPEVLSIRLQMLEPTQGFMLNQEVRQQLDLLIQTLDSIEEWEKCYFENQQFIVIEGQLNV
ncbi:hypothetical protein PQC65_gp064 [Aeromonas phage pAEv1810]|jgi:hypothetical protein|uniref:hypothetical protein n=1 Tax=Aeromonas phage pAEv1810 TaxID=2908744 RepID=UPI0023290CBF|nr:hypothetical protein PQC65_gp064 [Aeromonas phage pAEv1810]UIS25002.1 hypothetical protein pAEv1810_64 [Aeromonas phage pAEv1810]